MRQEEVPGEGEFFAAGCNASFPGHGANILNIDDPHASAQEADKTADPFLYFSSDKRRLEYLLGKELPHMLPADDTKPTERKTRISFELDPFFDLVTSFPELLGNNAVGSMDDA